MEIEIYRYQKFVVLALTWVKIFDFLTFHEVLIYSEYNGQIKYWKTGYQQMCRLYVKSDCTFGIYSYELP